MRPKVAVQDKPWTSCRPLGTERQEENSHLDLSRRRALDVGEGPLGAACRSSFVQGAGVVRAYSATARKASGQPNERPCWSPDDSKIRPNATGTDVGDLVQHRLAANLGRGPRRLCSCTDSTSDNGLLRMARRLDNFVFCACVFVCKSGAGGMRGHDSPAAASPVLDQF